MHNLPVIHLDAPLASRVINGEQRSIVDFNDAELHAYYAETAEMYARQIRELYLDLLDAPLRRADLATAARMYSLTQELTVMTILTRKGAQKAMEVAS